MPKHKNPDYKYDYVRVRKTITNPKLIRAIKELANDKLKTDEEICTDLITEGAAKAIEEKRKNSINGLKSF